MRHDEMRAAARSPEDACSPAGLNYEELQRYHATCSKLDERSIELLLDRLDELAIEIHSYLLGSSDEEDGDRFLPQ
jgi:ubiquitin